MCNLPILNGFLRGVYDKEITASIDNNAFLGVATELQNWIPTKIGALSKRAGFRFRESLESQSYLIPYIYDADQRYLLQFFEEDGKAKFFSWKYSGNTLIKATFSTVSEIIQPEFTSNSQDGYEITQSRTINNVDAYRRFNFDEDFNNELMIPATTNDYWVQIKFPKSVVLTEVSAISALTKIETRILPGASAGRPGGQGFLTIYHYNRLYWDIQGSTDGDTWNTINPATATTPSGGNCKQVKTYVDSNPYQYFRIRTTGGITDSYNGTENATLGNIKLSVLLAEAGTAQDSPYTIEQVRQLHWANENQRMLFFHPDVAPQELLQTIKPFTATGLDFETLGNPTFGCFYQERLGLGGYTKKTRQFNFSESNPDDKVEFKFTLPTSQVLSTSAMQFVIRNAKYPLKESLAGRNMVYLQCIDGIATISSGGDEIPLTPTQVSANMKNHTPMSDIPAVYQEEMAFLVGSDYKTVYVMDYDFNVMRLRVEPINEHCISYFDSGIAQMITMKAKLPYLVFRLNNGELLLGYVFRTTAGIKFSLFPLKVADGTVSSIATLMNDTTGYDTLFAIIEHTNGITTLESLESPIEQYSEKQGRDYFLGHLTLDTQYTLDLPIKSDIKFTKDAEYTAENGEVKYTADTLLPDFTEIRLYDSAGWSAILKNCRKIDDTSFVGEAYCVPKDFPDTESYNPYKCPDVATGYQIPSDIWQAPLYDDLNAIVFDGDDVVEIESVNDDGEIKLRRPIYNGTIGVPYLARGVFENLTDVKGANFEKTITNISACIMYGTSIKIGTESTLKNIGFWNYPYSTWQDRILEDESLKNIPLQDSARKNKKIVLECEYPFPASITFIVYDMKITGVK